MSRPPKPITGPDDLRHGTINGYSNHNCRCDRCREAWRVWHLDYMRRDADQREKHRLRSQVRYYDQKSDV